MKALVDNVENLFQVKVQLVLDKPCNVNGLIDSIIEWSITKWLIACDSNSLPKDCDPQLNGERQQECGDWYVAGSLLCQTANARVEEWHAEIDHLEHQRMEEINQFELNDKLRN